MLSINPLGAIDAKAVPASLWRRLGAMFYDGLLVLALWMMTLFLMVIANDGRPVFGAAVQCSLFLELIIFFGYFWCSAGQTVGMRAWRLHLVSNQGGAIGLNQALVRVFVAVVAFGGLGIGYLWALFDREKRTWTDLASHSRVVHRAK